MSRTLPPRWSGLLLLSQGLLALAPVMVLGPRIDWPASLDASAAEQMLRIAAHPDAVRWGYTVYLLYSLLTLPAMALLERAALPSDAPGSRALAATVTGFAAASMLGRCIGILRWLTVMPLLAAEHATADAAGRAEIERVFSALNAWGGAVGELLGVSACMAAAMLLLMVPSLRLGTLPRPLAASGLVAAMALAALLVPALGGPDLMPVTLAVSGLSLWQLATGGWLLMPRRAAPSPP